MFLEQKVFWAKAEKDVRNQSISAQRVSDGVVGGDAGDTHRTWSRWLRCIVVHHDYIFGDGGGQTGTRNGDEDKKGSGGDDVAFVPGKCNGSP